MYFLNVQVLKNNYRRTWAFSRCLLLFSVQASGYDTWGELQLGHAAEERAKYRQQDKNDGPLDTRATDTRVIHHFHSLFFIPPATIK